MTFDPDNAAERAAFLKWWEGDAAWSGTPCAVAFAGWLAGKAHALTVPSDGPSELTLARETLKEAIQHYSRHGERAPQSWFRAAYGPAPSEVNARDSL